MVKSQISPLKIVFVKKQNTIIRFGVPLMYMEVSTLPLIPAKPRQNIAGFLKANIGNHKLYLCIFIL